MERAEYQLLINGERFDLRPAAREPHPVGEELSRRLQGKDWGPYLVSVIDHGEQVDLWINLANVSMIAVVKRPQD